MRIDGHVHLFDIYDGGPIHRPLRRFPLGPLSVLEWSGFRRPAGRRQRSATMMRRLAAWECRRRLRLGTPQILAAHMRRNRFDYAVVMPIAPMVPTAVVVEACRTHPGLVAFASPDFTRPDTADDLSRALSGGCRGVKIHPVLQDIDLGGPVVAAVLEVAAQRCCPVCIHVGPCDTAGRPPAAAHRAAPAAVAPLVRAFPRVPFILAHMGLADYPEVVALARQCANVWLDVSFQPARVLRRAAAAVGTRRLVFGSDFPLLDPAAVRRTVTAAFGRDPAALERIMGGNLKPLLDAGCGC